MFANSNQHMKSQMKLYGALQGRTSPFRGRSRSISPSQRMNRQASPVQHASPTRGTSMRPHRLQQQQQLSHSPVAKDVMPNLQQKLQADFDRYARLGRQNMSATGRQSMSSTQRQKPIAYRSLQGNPQPVQEQGGTSELATPYSTEQHAQMENQHSGVSSRRLQAAHSMDRQRRLMHQRTADVVPRLDSLGYGVSGKQVLSSRRSILGRRGQSGRASAPPWTAGGQSSRRLSPSRFAEREQEPLLDPGLAGSQRIGAVH